jgi:hypothetical protein
MQLAASRESGQILKKWLRFSLLRGFGDPKE